ncbi:MAG TPA: glycerol-3-phosphate dehydrogenase/oxidase [Anaerolineales bacterium]|nr:glycerol-3-phosphate dehydrogenase/oxidase [Anaerolineales bacterium]
MKRENILAGLRAGLNPSVLVIGGGINGIGTFRDLALQDVDVLLVDRGDFCSGASAASSHMAHGGIRYLENGEFRLVREAVRERNRLLENAAHCVRPLPTTIPIFSVFSGLFNAPFKFLRLRDRPAERGALVIKIGLVLYDAFTGRSRAVPPHRFRGRAASLERSPELNPEVLATAEYHDAAILNPERLCLELILDAEAANAQARALNYCPVAGLQEGRVILEDLLSGERFAVQPEVVVNAAGPWIDRANGMLERETAFIGGTKGSHLVLDHPALREAAGDSEFFFENDDGRIVLILPYFDRVLVGTSDIRIDDPDEAVCTEAEVDYFLAMIRRVFPAIVVERDAIVFRFSGVRPLPGQSAAMTGQISRDHSIEILERGDRQPFPILSLIGGKWTTFRAFAEQASDLVLEFLGVRRSISTETLPIGGGDGFPKDPVEREARVQALARGGIAADRAAELLDRYGSRANHVAAYTGAAPDQALPGVPGFSRREIEFIALEGKVVHLDDLLLRRTLLGKLGRVDQAAVRTLGEVVGDVLGWEVSRVEAEIDRTVRIFRERHQVELL